MCAIPWMRRDTERKKGDGRSYIYRTYAAQSTEHRERKKTQFTQFTKLARQGTQRARKEGKHGRKEARTATEGAGMGKRSSGHVLAMSTHSSWLGFAVMCRCRGRRSSYIGRIYLLYHTIPRYLSNTQGFMCVCCASTPDTCLQYIPMSLRSIREHPRGGNVTIRQ